MHSHMSLTALLITNEDAGLGIKNAQTVLAHIGITGRRQPSRSSRSARDEGCSVTFCSAGGIRRRCASGPAGACSLVVSAVSAGNAPRAGRAARRTRLVREAAGSGMRACGLDRRTRRAYRRGYEARCSCRAAGGGCLACGGMYRRRPAASRTADLLLLRSNPRKGSPVGYRKTALTWEPPYGIEP